MALNIDQYVCNESVVCNGTVYWTLFAERGSLEDIRVTHERIILSKRECDGVSVYPLKKIDFVSLGFDSTLNMWSIRVHNVSGENFYIRVSQLDWANTLFNNIQYYSVFN